MPKPADMPDDEWEEILEKKATQRQYEMEIARIEREGFESTAYDAEPADVCWRRKWKKLGRKSVWEPCGEKPIVVLKMVSPDNPEGLRVPFCRPCLAAYTKDLITNLEMF